MARKIKTLIGEDGIDRREVGYYSTPDFVARYITEEMLRLNPNGNCVLDPATGKEELLPYFHAANKRIDSFDIIDHGNHNYSDFHCADFLEYYISRLQCLPIECQEYDYMIANPPYNCHEVSYIKDNKKRLSSAFSVGAYNMYSMFLSAMISLAKDGCLIGVIISDSFLTATLHAKLREQIFTQCTIHQLILCPNNLFWSQGADVRTCIMILQKGTQYQRNIQISNRSNSVEEFQEILSTRRFKRISLDEIRLGKDKSVDQFIIDIEPDIVSLFKANKPLGDIFKCVTCISTGNDEKYLSKEKKEGFSVPFYKNPAKRKFKTEPDAFIIDDYMEESLKVKDFMVRNKGFLRDEGIACSSMGLPFSAAYKPKDAVSGVNATIFPGSNNIFWLISYLNSSLVTYLVRGILIRSNMITSGYVSRIPIIELTHEEKQQLDEVAQNVVSGILSERRAIEIIDIIVFNASKISSQSREKILEFVDNLGKAV
jgi:hypothetical protein